MKELVARFVCSQCGRVESKWLGRCPDCGSWNSFTEEVVRQSSRKSGKGSPSATGGVENVQKPRSLSSVVVEPEFRFKTGITELDRVLGGGVMRGSAILLGGEPGIGKSTLMLQVLATCGGGPSARKTLYVSGEESPGQVRLRAERLGLALDSIMIFCDTRLEELTKILQEEKPSVVVIDSLQTLSAADIPSVAGSVNQIRACSMELVSIAKQLGIALFLIGHVTKEGMIAGPKVIEHMVDTVLYFDQAGTGVRLIRAAKNRFGSVDEIGIFLMTATGLEAVRDPAGFFISERPAGALPPGIAYTAVVEGTRTFLVEIQALCVPAKGGFSRVYSDRIDTARVTRVAAVLERHAAVRLNDQDIYVNVAGGMKLSEVSIELPLALALWSAVTGKSLPEKLVSFGELSLAGEVRSVGFGDKREKAAADMGFKRVLAPTNMTMGKQLAICRCTAVKDAITACSQMK
ncbi:MAG: DNA repair protein RadA [Sphaerochaetaceae bacterium]|jgi:DNA repair protein RadA/Sms